MLYKSPLVWQSRRSMLRGVIHGAVRRPGRRLGNNLPLSRAPSTGGAGWIAAAFYLFSSSPRIHFAHASPPIEGPISPGAAGHWLACTDVLISAMSGLDLFSLRCQPDRRPHRRAGARWCGRGRWWRGFPTLGIAMGRLGYTNSVGRLVVWDPVGRCFPDALVAGTALCFRRRYVKSTLKVWTILLSILPSRCPARHLPCLGAC